jgi:hypothetical protein
LQPTRQSGVLYHAGSYCLFEIELEWGLSKWLLNEGKEPHIQPLGEEYGTVVYRYQPKTDLKLFTKSLLKSRSAKRPPLPTDLASDSLVFESRFESGNLLQAGNHFFFNLHNLKKCHWKALFYNRI